ncbi:hypothetical protein ACFY3G_17915 [Streptomyces phaeochromogenes]|uniref:hypothetical protein n=1 Tax=Streptomyces phaeochromogenes TaxID=1923 RepID=UPI0036B66B06
MSQSTGVPAVDTLVIWSVAAVAIVGIATLAWRAVRGFRRIIALLDDLVEDWNGRAGRPGVPERPGVMERLGRIEGRVTAVEHEMQPNSGASLRDAVDRVDRRTRQLAPDTETDDT